MKRCKKTYSQKRTMVEMRQIEKNIEWSRTDQKRAMRKALIETLAVFAVLGGIMLLAIAIYTSS